MKCGLMQVTLVQKKTSLDFDFNYSANNITEAIGLESVPVGDYYTAWTASSDNSQPKISSMIVM